MKVSSFWRVFIVGLVFLVSLMYVAVQASGAAIKTISDTVIDCGYTFGGGTIPPVFIGVLLLAILVLGLFSSRMLFILMKTNKWISGMLALKSELNDDAIVRFQHTNGVPVDLVRDKRPFAFSYGLFRPRILVTTGQISLVDTEELLAILEHESHHCRRKDPLKVLIVKSLTFAFFFLPLLRPLQERFLVDKELEADQAAVRQVGLKPVASGLYKVLRTASFRTPESFAIGPNHVNDARIDGLLRGTVNRNHTPLRYVLISVVSLISIGTLVIFLYSSMTFVPMHMMMPPMN